MAINKNFVVKNGLEVSSNLLVANTLLNKVGLGTTTPRTLLDVRGGFISTDSYVSGISTVESTFYVRSGTNNTLTALGVGGSVGVGTALPSYLLDVRSPVSTGQTALYVQGDGRFTGNVNIEGDITLDEVTVRNINISGITTSNYLNVTGFGTVSSFFVPGTASIQTGIVTFISGTNLNYSGIVTANSISIGSTQVISNTRQLQNIVSFDATTTATIEAAISNAPNTFSDLRVTGITTLGVTSTTNLTAQNLNASGITTLGVTTTTNLTSQQLNVSGVSTLGVTSTTNLISQQLNVSGISTFAGITTVTGTTLFSKQLNVSGVSTLGTLQVSSGVVTATAGVVTYYGDGSNLTGVVASSGGSIGIQSGGVTVGTAITNLNFVGTGLTASQSGNTSNVYLPAPGVSLGLAIALGG